jgi:hypothetical protein
MSIMLFRAYFSDLFTRPIISCTICSLCLLFLSVFAQNRKDLAILYEQNKVEILKEYHLKNRINYDDWRLFVRAVFVENIDTVMSIYASIYKKTGDKKLKEFIRERVADFYYAKGYYETSQKILRDDSFFQATISANREEELRYGIQIGAFGTYENAMKAKNNLLNNTNDVTIIKKESKGNDLFIVVIGQYQSRSEAENSLNDLKRKNNQNGFIIQY